MFAMYASDVGGAVESLVFSYDGVDPSVDGRDRADVDLGGAVEGGVGEAGECGLEGSKVLVGEGQGGASVG